jgi:hypothetical protein
MRGETGMGFAPGDSVDAGFEATYALVSWQLSRVRLSTRIDVFETEERDFSHAENNDEEGSSVAFAAIFEPKADWSLALELTDLKADRLSAFQSIGTTVLDGRSAQVRIRYSGRFD